MALPYAQFDSINISLSNHQLGAGSGSRIIDIEWNPRRLDAVFLLIEPFDSQNSHKPTAVWLTTSTPRLPGFCLPLAEAHFKAYGLKAWEHQGNFKVVSSSDVEWDTEESRFMSIALRVHDVTRSILDCYEAVIPFPCHLDLSGSSVEKLPTTRMSPSTQCLILCQQQQGQRNRRASFQEWILLKGQQLLSLPDKNLESVLPSRRDLTFKILALRPETANHFHLVSASDVLHKHTYLSKDDLQQLMNKALALRRARGYYGNKVLLTHFFRNRWTAYFNDIFHNKGGLMEKYRKDANGDQDSAINNGNLFGLFFSPALDSRTLRPPTESSFGERRLSVASYILFRAGSRLYFADFYCHYQAHYITLVLTNRGSEADQFCEKRLIELNPQDNPFLTRSANINQFHEAHDLIEPPAQVYTTLCDKLHIEVLYTEDVPIKQLQRLYGEENVYMSMCGIRGRGRSLPQGIPKNQFCSICNLPPVDG